MPSAMLVIAAVGVIAILILAVWTSARRQRSADQRHSEQLHEQFGTEYERTLAEKGDARSTEAELTARQDRVSGYNIRHLAADEGQRFDDEWTIVQASFVDDPSAAVRDADALLRRVMTARGYPVGDFEQRSADMSVDHSPTIGRYREAHETALRDALGQANTEDLRQAVISSHVLFSELVEKPVEKTEPVEAEPEAGVLVAAE